MNTNERIDHHLELLQKQEIRTLKSAILVLEQIKCGCNTGYAPHLVTIQNAIDGIEAMGIVEFKEWEDEETDNDSGLFNWEGFYGK